MTATAIAATCEEQLGPSPFEARAKSASASG
jgi:hypothetical protein